MILKACWSMLTRCLGGAIAASMMIAAAIMGAAAQSPASGPLSVIIAQRSDPDFSPSRASSTSAAGLLIIAFEPGVTTPWAQPIVDDPPIAVPYHLSRFRTSQRICQTWFGLPVDVGQTEACDEIEFTSEAGRRPLTVAYRPGGVDALRERVVHGGIPWFVIGYLHISSLQNGREAKAF